MNQTRPTDERLREIGRQAEQAVAGGAVPPHPRIEGHGSYYRLPALKPPAWTWEVPLYFFIGGICGVSACMAFIAELFDYYPSLIRTLLWIAFAGSAICPMLLISDLGRPSRFLNMLRVFKWRSPMSMGAWILVTFSGCVVAALLGLELSLRGVNSGIVLILYRTGLVSGAVTGLLLAGYTGVLIGATAIPVWVRHRRILPAHFLASGLGGSSAILELCGFLIPATQFLGLAVAGFETLVGIIFESRRSPINAPLHYGRSGITFRIAGALEGPIALLLRVFWSSSVNGRRAAAIAFLFGALATRYAWIWAGRASAAEPDTQFEWQRSGGART